MTARGSWMSVLVASRPRFWFYLAGPVLVGAAFGATAVQDLATLPVIVLFVYFLLPANVLLYGINDVFDADLDALNPKKGDRELVWRGETSVLAAIIVAGLLGVVVFAVTPFAAWPYLGGFFALSLLYSTPPIRLKTTPVLDSLSNGLYILPGAVAYVSLAGTHPPAAAVVGGWLWAMGMHTFSAVPDIRPDRRAGIRTTATWLGESRALAYCFCCWSAAAVVFAAVDVRAGALLSLYPVVLVGIVATSVDLSRAYWWYPGLNTVVGAVLTVGGLWRLQSLTGAFG